MKKIIQMMLWIALGLAVPYAYGSQATPAKNTKKEQEIKGKKSDGKSNKSNASNTKGKDNNKDKTKEKNKVKDKEKVKDKDKKKDKTTADSKKTQQKNNKEPENLLRNSKTNLDIENAKNRNRNLANKTNLDAYPPKIIGMYASGTNKNACAPILAIYKKTKQWPSLQISTQKVSNPAEKLSCKPAKIKAMDGNFYVAENCRNEKNRSSDRHLIYIKNNDSLRVNSDNKTQVYVECNVNVASK